MQASAWPLFMCLNVFSAVRRMKGRGGEFQTLPVVYCSRKVQILAVHQRTFRGLFSKKYENVLKKAHMYPCALNDPEASRRFPIQKVEPFFQK